MEKVATHRSCNVTINNPANGIIDKPTQPCRWSCSRIGLTLHLPQFIKVQVAIDINLTRTLIARIPERLNLPCRVPLNTPQESLTVDDRMVE